MARKASSPCAKTRKPSLTFQEREQILELRDASVSAHEISSRVGRARSTIRNFLRDPENYGKGRKRAGRRLTLDEPTQRFIMKEAVKGEKTTVQIAEEAPMKVSARTVQRFLKKYSELRQGRPLPLPNHVMTTSSSEEEGGEDETEEDETKEEARVEAIAQEQMSRQAVGAVVGSAETSDGAGQDRSEETSGGGSASRCVDAATSASRSANARISSNRPASATGAGSVRVLQEINDSVRLPEPTRREFMELIDRRFDEMTQKISQLVESQNALIELLLRSSSTNRSAE